MSEAVEMKDSGVEWIGEIPETWKKVRLKFHLTLSLRYGVLKPDYYSGEDGVGMIRTVDLNDKIDPSHLMKISPELSEQFQRSVVEEGDLLICVVGTIGKLGKVSKELRGTNISRSVCRICISETLLNVNYFSLLLESEIMKQFINLKRSYSILPILNLENLDNFEFPLPPTLEEQRLIAQYLDEKTEQIDTLVELLHKKKETLQEYRQSLISSVVTGKVRVTEDMI